MTDLFLNEYISELLAEWDVMTCKFVSYSSYCLGNDSWGCYENIYILCAIVHKGAHLCITDFQSDFLSWCACHALEKLV